MILAWKGSVPAHMAHWRLEQTTTLRGAASFHAAGTPWAAGPCLPPEVLIGSRGVVSPPVD